MNISRLIAGAVVVVYSVLLDTLRVILTPLLRGVSERRGWDLDKRQKLPSPVRDFRNRNVVWLHAASLGEAKLLLKFVGMLVERHDDELYVVTATTRNGVAFLEKNRHPAFCAVGFLPLDTISLVERVITHYGVRRLWLLETELWPSLLRVCAKRSIPVGIVNGRIEQASFVWYRRLHWLVASLLEPVSLVFAQTDEYAERFASLGVSRSSLFTVGNIKGHIRIGRPDRHEWLSLRRSMNIDENAFVVTAGCMHKGEGTVLGDFHRRLTELGYPCKLIVVPRHLDETLAIIEEMGGKVVHLDSCSTARVWDVCIIEKIGILDAMYTVADAAVVGGTFTDIGGHNVWDAACYGIPVFFGPFHEKQKEGCDLLLEAAVGFTAEDGLQLGEKMFDVVKREPMRFLQAQQAFIALTNKIRSIVEPLLP